MSDIDSSISGYERRIAENCEKITKLKKRIEELKDIAEGIVNRENQFEKYQGMKKRSYGSMKTDLGDMKFVRECSEEMINYINADDSKNAESAFEHSKNIVSKEISKKEDEIEDLEMENQRLRSIIAQLEAEKSRKQREQ